MSLNAETWSPHDVSDWIAGLRTVDDRDFEIYSSIFLEKGVTGKLLLNLMTGDLITYGVKRVGDQLLLQDAIQALRSELDTPRVTLQTMASSLGVRCRNYRAELSLLSSANGGGKLGQACSSSSSSINYIPTDSLSSASYLLDSSKTLIRWLTRFPFLGITEYDEITIKLTKHCFELAMLSQRDSFADNAIEEVQYLCTKLIEICEGIIHSKDSLVIQPAAVDVITLRKRTEQELGLHLESSYFGLHQVSSVKMASPAQQSGHLAKGDEILQVNYQTVVGWPQQNVVHLLQENPNEVILTIKRRPRHATANILAHMYLRPSNKLMGNTNRSHKRHNSRHGADKISPSNLQLSSSGSTPSSLSIQPQYPRQHQKSMPISPVPEDENSSSSTTSSSANSPGVLLNVNLNVPVDQISGLAKGYVSVSTTVTADDGSASSSHLTSGPSLDTGDSDADANVLGVGINLSSGSDSNSASTKSPNSSSAHSRFWKLYPRPRNLIRRRATVTGASPTSTRPPVTFFDDESADVRLRHLRPPLINSKSAPEKIPGLRKQGHVFGTSADSPRQKHHRQTMPPSLKVDVMSFGKDASIIPENKTCEKETTPMKSFSESKLAEKGIPNEHRQVSISTSTTNLTSPANRNYPSEKAFDYNYKELLRDTTPPDKPSRVEPIRDTSKSPEKLWVEPIRDITKPLPSAKPIKVEPITKLSPEKSLPELLSVFEDKEPFVVYKGILHLRQSPTNLLVKSNSLSSTSGSATGTGFSAHPRWTRHPAILNSARILQIGSDSEDSLQINLGKVPSSEAEVSLAKEVHSRPFAFKIDVKSKTKLLTKNNTGDDKAGIFYLAAESQQEFEIWMKHLMKPEASELLFRSTSSGSGMKELMYHKMRQSGPPVYKRSISLGNSPAYSRRNSYQPQSSRESSAGSSTAPENIHPNRSFILRKNNLIRSSRLVGNSTPNVQVSSTSLSTTTATSSYANSSNRTMLSPGNRKSTSESVKSEWFTSPTPTTPPPSSPRRFFNTATATPYRSPTATTPLSASALRSPNSDKNGSTSNISSITIRSLLRKSESTESSTTPRNSSATTPLSPGPGDFTERTKSRSSSSSRLPCMGVSMVLAKQSNQSPLSSPKKMMSPSPFPSTPTTPNAALLSPKKSYSSSTSTSSSSDVFIKNDAVGAAEIAKHKQRLHNCPSCGGSSSSFSKSDKSVPVKDMSTQTENNSPLSPNLEQLRNLINEQEGSRV